MDQLPGDVFAHRLRQERERMRISQAELARRVAALTGSRIDPSAITRIEQQTRAVRLDEAVFCAQVLEVPLTSLLSDDEPEEAERAIQDTRAQLLLAQQQWEEDRLEVVRLTKLLADLTNNRTGLHAEGEIDPRLEEAIDDEMPSDERPSSSFG